MSLSVSSFPGAPSELSHNPKWQEASSPKSKRGFFCSLLCKRSAPLLKGIRHRTKSQVKESVIHHPVDGPPSRSQHSSSLSRSSIRASSIVIDIIAVPHNDESFPIAKSSDADTSSVELSPPPSIHSAVLPIFSAVEPISATPTIEPINGPYRPYPLGDSADTSGTVLPTKGHDGIAPVVDNSLHDPRSHAPSTNDFAETPRQSHATTPRTAFPSSEITTFPTSRTTTPQSLAAPSTVGRLRRPLSVLAGVRTAEKETMAPRPRCKSETARRRTFSSRGDSSERKGRRKSPAPQLPANTRASVFPKPRQQQNETTRVTRALSGASSKSVRSRKSADSPLASTPLLNAHVLLMRSGSRPSPTRLLFGHSSALQCRHRRLLFRRRTTYFEFLVAARGLLPRPVRRRAGGLTPASGCPRDQQGYVYHNVGAIRAQLRYICTCYDLAKDQTNDTLVSIFILLVHFSQPSVLVLTVPYPVRGMRIGTFWISSRDAHITTTILTLCQLLTVPATRILRCQSDILIFAYHSAFTSLGDGCQLSSGQSTRLIGLTPAE
ncbi:hypothetical protein BJV74DRAFT_797020 [Russula compacta]|nr:hypothetical protein BJV74DRAFT_797020 [Russula compacta]